MDRHIRDTFPTIDNILVQTWVVSRSGRLRPSERFSVHNLVTNAGKDYMADRVTGSSVPAVNWLAIGTGVTTPNVNDTALQTEVFRDSLTSATRVSVGVATFTYFLNTASANGNTLGELGLFNAASLGTLVARAVLTPTIIKNNTKAVTFTWNVTFA